ncbi:MULTISPECIES: glycogen branching protein [Pseudomonas]|uniref:hypothetical protein n=1 Tax=Pseudomonadaceae TaxID=135621 RepID=UPI00106DDE3A|nr:glycogen branching protein [Pseudomonas khazarica]
MPKIKITQAFNFHSGGVTKHYEKGERDVTQAVADHAVARGYSPKPAEPEGDAAPPAAEPAAAKAAKKA